MKILVALVLSCFWISPIDLGTIRADFEKADNSKANTEHLYHILKGYDKGDPVIQAYKGAVYGLQARYITDKKDKKELVVAGIKNIEAAVKSAPNNVEIRLIRLIIQENTPKILKYKMDIDTDKQMILTNFSAQNTAVKDLVRRYVTKRSGVFTASEIDKLSK
ncbi:hypothetical protein [Sphingobacterium pedocola]|uniref:DUF4252 domain-containing protein n=1 Tax=Sphingobacterium pedocola TaxID=2082722 RepID=A0ABR9TAQ1_9SPHI|nr:hypothetical protein [Sphingobacterium pedocola]MBE8721747.1 hypothetical protein [Sphingobacterium pedocola]